MAKLGFWSLGATLLVGGLLSGCSPPDGGNGSVTEVKSAVTSPLFSPYVAYPTGSSPQAVAIGDLDGDGRNDVALTTDYNFDPANDYMLHVFIQASDGTLKPRVQYPLS
ncbi:MAG TPA: VCBS repeat-containing protein, partial [Polyangia bacterium]